VLYSGYIVLKIHIEDGKGDWVKCDGLKIGVKVGDQYHFDDTPNFSLESAMTMTKAVQLSIKISGIRIVMSALAYINY